MFERNYERAPETASLGKTYDLGIGDAVQLMEHGYLVARDGWNTKRMWIGMQKPASHSRMTVPYLYLEYPVGHPACPNGCRVPWLPSQTDLLAKDYQVVRLGE
jgi:hypothetical protein